MNTSLSRRNFIHASIAGAGLYGLSSCKALEESPSSLREVLKLDNKKIPYINITEDGPLYPPTPIPWLKDLTINKPEGQILYLFGKILDSKGKPIPHAVVEIWQADNTGTYKHPRVFKSLDPGFGYFGKVKSASDGSYMFKTIVPKWYTVKGLQRAAHIHIKMKHAQYGVLTTEMYFSGKEEDEIRKQDKVFKSRFNPDGLIIERQSPQKFQDLKYEFDSSALCCQYDLAFIF